MLEEQAWMLASTAYEYKSVSTAWIISLTQIKKSAGPKNEHWRTPQKIFVKFETRFAISTVKWCTAILGFILTDRFLWKA